MPQEEYEEGGEGLIIMVNVNWGRFAMKKETKVLISLLLIVLVVAVWYFGFTEKHYQRFCKDLGYDDGTHSECYRFEGNRRIFQRIDCNDFTQQCFLEIEAGGLP